MTNPLSNLIHWYIDILTGTVEYFAGMFGRFAGIFLARLWGPMLKYGTMHYRDEMAKFVPEIILHLRAMNDMLLTIMEDAYEEHRNHKASRQRVDRRRAT